MTTLHQTASTATARAGVSRYAGIAFVVLFVAPFAIWSRPPYVYEGGSLAVYAKAFEDGDRLDLSFYPTFILFPLAAACLLWAAGHIHRVIATALGSGSIEGQLVVLGATVLAVGFTLTDAASSAAAHVATGSSDGGFPAQPVAGYSLEMLASQVFSVSMWGGAVMLVATGIAARRAHLLPGWLTWAGFVIAPLLVVAFVFFMLPLLAFVLWVATAGFLMKTERVPAE